jgi:hypothetical protein
VGHRARGRESPRLKLEIVQVMAGSQKVVGAFTEITGNVPSKRFNTMTLHMKGIWGHLRHNGKKGVIPTFPGMA